MWLFADYVSLVVTVPTILLAIAVVVHFREALTQMPKKAQEWLVFGVVVSFMGQVLDNTYWGFVWTGDFLAWDGTGKWIQRGPLFNIFSRQLCGIAAAACHIRAAWLWGAASREWVRVVYLLASAAMFAWGVFLIISKLML